MSYELEEEIIMLIDSKREDDYWDFKQQHHTNKADLLLDIICMANNRVDRDAYIIFGIADKTFEVIGVENDENRKNQQNIIDFLKSKSFISGIRPRVELRTLIVAGHEVDVLIVKNSTDTPYFLTDKYSDGNRTVRANHIYTRVGDTNTDIDKSADINNIEYLWKKRFLLTRSPFEQIIKRLEKKDEWKQDEDTYYNIYNPEFTITIEFDEDDRRNLTPEFYSYAMYNESTMYQILSIKYFGTQLYGKQIALLDSGRYCTPTPDRAYLYFGEHRVNADYGLRFFTKDSPAYKLNEFLFNEDSHEAGFARKRFFEVVLLFEDTQEKDTFLGYVHINKKDFLDKYESFKDTYSWIESNNNRQREHIVDGLKTGKVLIQMLEEFRQSGSKI